MSPSTRVLEKRFDDRQTLAEALATSIAADLAVAVAARGAASLVVSGGSTPEPLFRALSKTSIAWHSVQITLADERWVPSEDPASNAGLVRRLLLVERAAAASFTGLKNDAATPEEGAPRVEQSLRGLSRPFDVTLLGMGEDGHTASLFPGAAELAAGLDRSSGRDCLAVRPPKAPHARLSLTLPALLDSRRIVVLITGKGKWEIYRKALVEESFEKYPIAAVLQSAAERVEVFWSP